METRPLWPFQAATLKKVFGAWQSGTRRVLLVAPTGAGKTRMGVEPPRRALAHGHRVLWLVHRRELLQQAHDKLWEATGIQPTVAANGFCNPDASLVVATVQALAAAELRPPARLVVFDEAHHYVADEWGRVAQYYASAAILGLTATPERSDGRPIGGLFEELIVAAGYPKLVEGGYLVPARVFQPERELKDALALDPVKAFQQWGRGKGMVFAPSVELAYEWAEKFSAAGIPTECVEQKTAKLVRDAAVRDFRAGVLRVLTNVYVLTEGFDVPDVETVVLGRKIGHVTPYLQMVGRGLRAHPGKSHCVVIDLAGNCYKHGLPIEEREYSLGKGIIRKRGALSLRVCLHCGFTYEGSVGKCPNCGQVAPTQAAARPTIYDLTLREVYDGEATPEEAKRAELARLLNEGEQRGWSYAFVVREYERLFNSKPKPWLISDEIKRREWESLVARAREKGYQVGWAAHRWRTLFGFWPPREWQKEKEEHGRADSGGASGDGDLFGPV